MGNLSAEERRLRFEQMLQIAEQEADRDGHVSVDSVLAEIDQIIDAAKIMILGILMSPTLREMEQDSWDRFSRSL